jgi:hypothetical protein
VVLICSIVEEEKKRRKEVEIQLAALQAEKKIALAAAAQLVNGNEERASEMERELARLKAEMEALNKNNHSSTGQGKQRHRMSWHFMTWQ